MPDMSCLRMGGMFVIKLGDRQFRIVNVADSPGLWAKGLSGRAGLQKGTGMLFIYPAPFTNQTFWMKGMLFSIDVIFIGENDKVIDVVKSLSPPSSGWDVARVQSSAPVKMALEIGSYESNGVEVGDSCEFL